MTVLFAEIKKQHRNWFHSKFTYFSLLIWPILIFLNAYYTYKPFRFELVSSINVFSSKERLIVFLITGFMGYNCFWTMVQSAWQMGFERQNGTLEIVFMTPSNKLVLMYGRALGAIVENIWMFSVFSAVVLLTSKLFLWDFIWKFPIIFIVLIVTSTIWGGLMNIIFLFSRDSTFLFSLLDEPMSLFSGVRIPINIFPIWVRIISSIFPLTHSLYMIRSILFCGNFDVESFKMAGMINGAIIIISVYLLNRAEIFSRKNGEFNFY